MQTDTPTLAIDVSPRTRGLFIKNLADFQTELARVHAGFVPAMIIWAHRKKLPMLIFQSMRRIQDLRVRARELGLSLGQLHLSTGVACRGLLDELCHAQTPADLLHAGMILIPRLLATAIDDYLKNNNGVYDSPSAPLLEASRNELNLQIKWAEEAVSTLKRDTGQQPQADWVDKVTALAAGLPEALEEHTHKTAKPMCAGRRTSHVCVR